MVNGVLVERTVEDVLPTLKTNSDGLKQVIEDMLKQYKTKQNELDTWKVCILAAVAELARLETPNLMGTIWTVLMFVLPCRKRTISRLCSLRGMLVTRLLSIYIALKGCPRVQTICVTRDGKRQDSMQSCSVNSCFDVTLPHFVSYEKIYPYLLDPRSNAILLVACVLRRKACHGMAPCIL